MTIWVDADSCPKRARQVIEKAANKRNILSYFVANRKIPITKTAFVQDIITESTDQAADNYIVENASSYDLVITRDIPLAKRLVDAKITVINDRGVEFTSNDINTRLSIRNFMYELSSSGLKPETTDSFSPKDLQKFAACFDRVVSKLQRLEKSP